MIQHLYACLFIFTSTDSPSAAQIQLTSVQQHQLQQLQQQLQQLIPDSTVMVPVVSSTIVKMMVSVSLRDRKYVPVPFVMDTILRFFKRQQRELSQVQLQQLQKELQLQIREDMASLSFSLKKEQRQQRRRRDTERNLQKWKSQKEQLEQIQWIRQMLPLFWVMLAISLVEQRQRQKKDKKHQPSERLEKELINEIGWAFALLKVEKRQIQCEKQMKNPPKQLEQREPLLLRLEKRLIEICS